MTLIQRLKTKNRRRSSKRNNSEHVSIAQKLRFDQNYKLPKFILLYIINHYAVNLCLLSIYKACDCPPQLPQYQLQPGREDDGDPGPGRLDHPTQQQRREPSYSHLESKKQTQGYNWLICVPLKMWCWQFLHIPACFYVWFSRWLMVSTSMWM